MENMRGPLLFAERSESCSIGHIHDVARRFDTEQREVRRTRHDVDGDDSMAERLHQSTRVRADETIGAGDQDCVGHDVAFRYESVLADEQTALQSFPLGKL